MGLLKETKSPLGVPLQYHRVTSLFVHTNVQNTIEISSYISLEERERELEHLFAEVEKTKFEEGYPIALQEITEEYQPVLIETAYAVTPYDQYMTIESAYDYLKTLPEFEGAIDC